MQISVVVLFQLWTATSLNNAGWLKILVIAYFFFGSILNHNLFLAIHELSHNLAFSTPVYNLQPSYWGSHVGHFPELSPVCLKPKPPGWWEFVNFVIQIALNAAMVYFWSWKSLAHLILSTFLGSGMHPMAGHFILEHYVFKPEQENYSYYGPLNLLTWECWLPQ